MWRSSGRVHTIAIAADKRQDYGEDDADGYGDDDVMELTRLNTFSTPIRNRE